MITIDDKIQLFRKIVLDDINREYNQLKNKLIDRKKVESLISEEEAKEKSKKYIEKFINKVEEEKKKKILDAKKESKEEILKIKNRFIEEVYQAVLKKCKAFRKEENYLKIIEKLVENIKNNIEDFKVLKVYIIEEDYEKRIDSFKEIFNKILDRENIKLYKSKENFRGGFVLYNKDKTLKLDISLKLIISRNKLFIGNEVQKLLDKDGELYE